MEVNKQSATETNLERSKIRWERWKALRSSTNDAWGKRGGNRKTEKKERWPVWNRNPRVKRKGATEKKPKNLTLRGKMSGLKSIRKKLSMLMQSQFFRNLDMKAKTERMQQRKVFFYCFFITLQTNFLRLLFLFLPLRRKRFPLGSILHPPADWTSLSPRCDPVLPHSFTVLHSSFSLSLSLTHTHSHIYTAYIHCGPHTQPRNLQRT